MWLTSKKRQTPNAAVTVPILNSSDTGPRQTEKMELENVTTKVMLPTKVDQNDQRVPHPNDTQGIIHTML